MTSRILFAIFSQAWSLCHASVQLNVSLVLEAKD